MAGEDVFITGAFKMVDWHIEDHGGLCKLGLCAMFLISSLQHTSDISGKGTTVRRIPGFQLNSGKPHWQKFQIFI